MNEILKKVVDIKCPKFNADNMNGLAYKQLKLAPQYLDATTRTTMKSLPDDLKDLEYLGYRKLRPEEDYRSIVNQKKSTYDIGISDIYKVEMVFSYENQKIRKSQYLPFARRGGIINLSNTKYQIKPVLSDTVISVSENNVYVEFSRDKLLYLNTLHNVICNDQVVTGQIIYSLIYKTNVTQNNLGSKIIPPTALYQFIRYGLHNTFKKFCGTVPTFIVDDGEKEVIVDRDKYDVYRSTGIRPSTLKRHNYRKNDLVILVEKGKRYNSLMDSLIYSILYTFDVFPEKAKEMMATCEKSNLLKQEKEYWKLILGTMIFKDTGTEFRYLIDMTNHIKSLESYVNDDVKEMLKTINIDVNDFFELQISVMESYNSWLIKAKNYEDNYFNRYLKILYYILFENRTSINRCIFEITKRKYANTHKAHNKLSFQEVNKIFSDIITPRKVYKILNSNGGNLALSLLDIVGDNLVFNVTTAFELQESGTGVNRGLGMKQAIPKGKMRIIGSDLFVGQVHSMKKSKVTPLASINPFTNFTSEGKIIVGDNEQIIADIDSLLRLSSATKQID